uniref:Uncharacterized protein n=1 Tax=Tanacetum cinerariifolium TaxID=118510 RepID=A0A6L2N9M9_TANCI|nr:hypothetical protein [Tanacetum cinerariifolium]
MLQCALQTDLISSRHTMPLHKAYASRRHRIQSTYTNNHIKVGLAGELGRLLLSCPIVSGADLLSLADYDPKNKEVKSGILCYAVVVMVSLQLPSIFRKGRLLSGEYGLERTLFHMIYLTQLEGSDALLLQQTQAKIPRNKKASPCTCN